jgi:predicted metal-dependent hydrolase
MTEYITIRIDDTDVPVKIITEKRRSIRAYMGKDTVIMRFPNHLTVAEKKQHRGRLEGWLRRQYAKREGVFQRYQAADYQDGDTLRVGQRQYELQLSTEARKTSSGKIAKGKIILKLSDQLDEQQRSEVLRKLLSRLVGADFLPYITQRVHELNQRHFQRPIKSVRLKYNHSNWGSCSNSGNVNLSTRLLFAPPEVIDYVIIHELAHLIELNHSHRFWAQVEKAMPDYQEKEAWLSEFGASCDF